MRNSRVFLLALSLGVALVASQVAGEETPKNLIVNGSFEDGPDVEGFVPLDKDSVAIKGWTVTRGQIDYIGTHWKSADGKRSLDLHGSPGYGGIQQTFATTKGRKYKVSFALAVNPNTSAEEKEKKLGVAAAGKMERFSFDVTGKTVDDMGWATKTWEFTADADKTTLEFYSLESTDPSFGPALDNVVVVEVK